MQVTVKLYGNLKKYAPGKQASAELAIDDGTTIAGLLARLQVPDGEVWMCAVNDNVVYASTALHDGDVLEVFEPVGGGSRQKVQGKRYKAKGKNTEKR